MGYQYQFLNLGLPRSRIRNAHRVSHKDNVFRPNNRFSIRFISGNGREKRPTVNSVAAGTKNRTPKRRSAATLSFSRPSHPDSAYFRMDDDRVPEKSLSLALPEILPLGNVQINLTLTSFIRTFGFAEDTALGKKCKRACFFLSAYSYLCPHIKKKKLWNSKEPSTE